MSQYAGISGAQNFHFVFIKQKSCDDVEWVEPAVRKQQFASGILSQQC